MARRHARPGGQEGGLTALDPYLKRDKLDPSIYYENEFKSSQFQGKTYVLPMAATGAWYLIFYNRDHFRDAGLDENRPPTTWDEAARYAGVLTKKGADGKIERLGFEPGFKDASIFNSPFVAWSATNGGAFASDDGRKLLFDSPQGAAALEWMLRTLQQIGGREALEDYVSRNRASNNSFTNAPAGDVPDQPLLPGAPQGGGARTCATASARCPRAAPAAPRASSAGAGPTASPPA